MHLPYHVSEESHSTSTLPSLSYLLAINLLYRRPQGEPENVTDFPKSSFDSIYCKVIVTFQ